MSFSIQNFFNNQYDDRIVWNAINLGEQQNYYHCQDFQDIYNGKKKNYHFPFSAFKIDHSLNARLNIHYNAYTLEYQDELIPYHSKEKYLSKYGMMTQLSIDQCFTDVDMFKYFIIPQINYQYYFNVEIALSPTGTIVIIQPDENNRGFTSLVLEELHSDENTLITLSYVNKSEIKTFRRSKAVIFASRNYIDGVYWINTEEMFNLNNIKRDSYDGKYVMYINALSPTNESLMLSLSPRIKIENNTTFVGIPKESADFIKSHVSTCNIYLRYHKNIDAKEFIINVNEMQDNLEGSSFAFNFIENNCDPVCAGNISVYYYNEDTKLRYGVMKNCNIQVDTPYPRSIVIEGDKSSLDLSRYGLGVFNTLLIEIDYVQRRENTTSDDCFRLFLTRFADPDVNRNCEAMLDRWKKWFPLRLSNYDYREFMESYHYPDIRGFRFEHFNEILDDNYMRLKYVQKELDRKNRLSIRRTFYQKENPNSPVFTARFTDTRLFCKDPKDSFKLPMPCSYILIHNHFRHPIRSGILIYVNGVRVKTEYIVQKMDDCYAFFNANALDATITTNVIDIEAFLYDSSPFGKKEEDITFFSITAPCRIPQCAEFDLMSLRHLMLVDKRSSVRLSPSEMKFKYIMKKVAITNPNMDDFEYMYDVDDFDYFMVLFLKFFQDAECVKYTVRAEPILEDIVSPFTHKILNLNNAYICLQNPQWINQNLILTNTNNYRKVYSHGSIGSIVRMNYFKEFPDKDRFRVYFNGRLLRKSEFDISIGAKYSDAVTMTITNLINHTNETGFIIFEYLPIEETILYEGIPDTELYHDDLFWLDNLDEFKNRALLSGELKVFINGYRIPLEEVVDINALSIFRIPKYKAGDYIQIYMTADDPAIQVLRKDRYAINLEMLHNPLFLEYMKNNNGK